MKKQAVKIQQTKKALIEAMEVSLGVVTTACKKVGVNRSTYYDYYNNDPEFREAINDLSEVALDFVESKLFSQINQDNTAATIFYLKTKGKHRGYIERQEVDNKHDFSVDSFLSQFKNRDVE